MSWVDGSTAPSTMGQLSQENTAWLDQVVMEVLYLVVRQV
jgi:hypothetical protein